MSLPDDLKNGLQVALQRVPRNALAQAAEELSKRYRSPVRDHTQVFMNTDLHRLAYLAVRMPATYAVVTRVLTEIQYRMPAFAPKTLGDLGSGPGTASWAATKVFSSLATITLLEQDNDWLRIGHQLMQHSSHSILKAAKWRQNDLRLEAELGNYDLAVLSYVIGELPVESLPGFIDKAWKATSQVLVIIEPGTPHGFERIRIARQKLIELGGFLVAPCPHHRQCPMPPGDWCHFVQRLERSELHMAVKEVDRGYEDEKFSYVVAARSPVVLPEARVLRYPGKHSGHVDLFLCAQSGLEQRTISKKQGPAYKHARKLDWGDIL